MSTNLILERASKNLLAVQAAAAKAVTDLGTLTTEAVAQAEKIEDLKAAVAAAVGAAQRDAKAEALQVEATHKVATAEKDAQIQQQTTQLNFMSQQIVDLRKQIDDERTARVAIAQADSAKQAVQITTGK